MKKLIRPLATIALIAGCALLVEVLFVVFGTDATMSERDFRILVMGSAIGIFAYMTYPFEENK